ncbi:hypothetical protein B484DRAFT_403771 [Ochromonadaceae sp. CCMP2298]|nr:hypothetical protein B484DRAFT_403771 [Ochromonadaceae sp. CCMP2298]
MVGSVWEECNRDSIQVAEFQTDEVQQLHERVHRRDVMLQVHEAEIEELHGRVARREAEIEELHGRVARREAEIEELHGRVARREEVVEELLGRVARREEVVEDLIAAVEELRGRVARRDCELETQWSAATAEATRRAASHLELTQLRLDLADTTRRAASPSTYNTSQQLQKEGEVLRRTLDARSESESRDDSDDHGELPALPAAAQHRGQESHDGLHGGWGQRTQGTQGRGQGGHNSTLSTHLQDDQAPHHQGSHASHSPTIHQQEASEQDAPDGEQGGYGQPPASHPQGSRTTYSPTTRQHEGQPEAPDGEQDGRTQPPASHQQGGTMHSSTPSPHGQPAAQDRGQAHQHPRHPAPHLLQRTALLESDGGCGVQDRGDGDATHSPSPSQHGQHTEQGRGQGGDHHPLTLHQYLSQLARHHQQRVGAYEDAGECRAHQLPGVRMQGGGKERQSSRQGERTHTPALPQHHSEPSLHRHQGESANAYPAGRGLQGSRQGEHPGGRGELPPPQQASIEQLQREGEVLRRALDARSESESVDDSDAENKRSSLLDVVALQEALADVAAEQGNVLTMWFEVAQQSKQTDKAEAQGRRISTQGTELQRLQLELARVRLALTAAEKTTASYRNVIASQAAEMTQLQEDKDTLQRALDAESDSSDSTDSSVSGEDADATDSKLDFTAMQEALPYVTMQQDDLERTLAAAVRRNVVQWQE